MTKCNNPQCPNQDDCLCGENCPCTKEHNCAQYKQDNNMAQESCNMSNDIQQQNENQ